MRHVLSETNWIPIRVYWQGTQPMVDWSYLGEIRFTDSFFEQTIERCLRHPFNLLFRHQTPIEILEEVETGPHLKPTGFIFHMSRCGSTLVSQTLAALPQNIVLSEPGLVDTILRAQFRDPAATEERRIAWLRGIIAALGRPRNTEERHYFIKFDSWSAFDLPLIRRAFPEVPWIFLYRDPVEVMVSQVRSRGSQMVPGVIAPETLGLNLASIYTMSLDEYCARVLGQICTAAAEQLETGSGLAVQYRQLPEILFSSLLGFFNVAYTADELEQMRQATLRDAKNPWFEFQDDTQAKQSQVTEAMRALATEHIEPAYQRLEVLNQRLFPRI